MGRPALLAALAILLAAAPALAQDLAQARARFDEGRARYAARKYEQAIASMRQVLALARDLTIAHLWIARAQFRLGRYEDALAAYEEYQTRPVGDGYALVIEEKIAGQIEDVVRQLSNDRSLGASRSDLLLWRARAMAVVGKEEAVDAVEEYLAKERAPGPRQQEQVRGVLQRTQRRLRDRLDGELKAADRRALLVVLGRSHMALFTLAERAAGRADVAAAEEAVGSFDLAYRIAQAKAPHELERYRGAAGALEAACERDKGQCALRLLRARLLFLAGEHLVLPSGLKPDCISGRRQAMWAGWELEQQTRYPTPVHRRPWFRAVMGASAGAVAAAVGLGVGLGVTQPWRLPPPHWPPQALR